MILSSRRKCIGSKPIFRVLATIIASFLAFLFLHNLSLSNLTVVPPTVPIGGQLRSFLSKQSSFNTFYHQYESPQDVIVPQAHGRELATESLIGKVTILFHGKDPTYVRALQTHEGHNRRYGYPMYVLRHQILENIWSKPAYILAAILEEMRKPEGHRLKWLFWFDADTVVMNPKISLDVFLPPEEYPHIHLLVTADPRFLNNGVFFIRVHPWSVELLSAIIAYPNYEPDVQLEYRDQSALWNLLQEKPFKKNYLLVPQRWFNAYQAELNDDYQRAFQINRGDLLVHFPGVPSRDERMRAFIDRAERHLQEWELDYQNTTYPREIKEYWAETYEKLAKQREEAAKAVQEAEELLLKTKSQLAIYREQMHLWETDEIEAQMAALKQSLTDKEDNADATHDAMQKVQDAGAPLHNLVAEKQQALAKRANAVIVTIRSYLSASPVGNHSISKEQLESKLDVLAELLVRSPDDAEGTEKAVVELEEMCAQMEREAKDTSAEN